MPLTQLKPQDRLRGRKAKTEILDDRHDPNLLVVDRVNDLSGGVNFRDYTLVKDNQAIELYNMYPNDIFKGRDGYSKYNSTEISNANRIEALYRLYVGTSSKHLLCIAAIDAADKMYYGNDTTGAMTEVTGGTAFTGNQKYSLVGYKDDVFIASENQTLQFSSNGTTKADCGGDLPTAAGHLLEVHEDRLWSAGQAASRDTIEYSKVGVHDGDPSTNLDFATGGTITINQGDGDYITAIKSFSRVLYVFKRTYVAQVFGSARFTFEVFYPPINKGAMGHKAVAVVGDKLYFVAWDGVYAINAGGQMTSISSNIEPIFRTKAISGWNINKSAMDKIVLFEYDGYLWMSYPSENLTYCDKVMIYDPVREAWYPQKGMDINCACAQNGYGDQNELRTGSAKSGFVYKMKDNSYTDAGSAIEFVYKSKYLDQEMPERSKQYLTLLVDIDTGEAESPTVIVDVDGVQVVQNTIVSTTPGLSWGSGIYWGQGYYWSDVTTAVSAVPLDQKMRGKRIAARFKYSSSTSRLKIRSFTFVCKPEMLER